MALIQVAPNGPLALVRIAISNWWQRGLIAKLTLEERDQLYRQMWEMWELRPADEKLCAQHQIYGMGRPLCPAFESLKIDLDHTGQQVLSLRTIDYCPGDENLSDAHTVMPHDYLVNRGQWSEICEIPLVA